MKTSSAKGKGRDLQKYVAKVIKDQFYLGDGDAESRPMGSSGVDIMMSPLAKEKFPFSPECKNTKTFPSLAALEQSHYNQYDDTLAGVVWKPFGKGMNKSIIYFNFEEFVDWWKEHTNGKEEE